MCNFVKIHDTSFWGIHCIKNQEVEFLLNTGKSDVAILNIREQCIIFRITDGYYHSDTCILRQWVYRHTCCSFLNLDQFKQGLSSSRSCRDYIILSFFWLRFNPALSERNFQIFLMTNIWLKVKFTSRNDSKF